MRDTLPFLDLADPGFSTRSAAVLAARAHGWCARTPFGLAVLRHRQAGQLLRDRRLRQGSHAWPATCGLTGSFAAFWGRSVISTEGEAHKRLRRIAQAALAEDWITSLKPQFGECAAALVAELPRAGGFDFMDQFADPFAGRAIALLLGLPAREAADVARDASTLGLAMGLGAKAHEAAINAATDRLEQLALRLLASGDGAPGIAGRLLAAARAEGHSDAPSLRDLVVISIFGGVDTTRAQLGFLMALLAEHPDQWAALRADPGLIGPAIEEAIRTRPTTTWATREALEAFTFDGLEIRAGETVHILVHVTGTDPEATDWQGFDITARRRGHFGFGGGAHHCLGQFVARTDMAAALRVLLANWKAIRPAGRPEYLPDTGNTSPARLPLAPVWA